MPAQPGAQLGDRFGKGDDVVELLAMGELSALNVGIEACVREAARRTAGCPVAGRVPRIRP